MLKIKKEVNLNILLNFGFELIEFKNKTGEKQFPDIYQHKVANDLVVFTETRELRPAYYCGLDKQYRVAFDVIYDLIQADLIQKEEN